MRKPCILFQTDFGVGGGGAMYGVCKRVDPELELFDLTHKIPKFDVEKASASLRDVIPFWPEGTVFVSVVDPGVGTARKACVCKTSNGYYIVTPDNGTLTYLAMEFGIDEIREIDETINRYKGSEKVDIFHGRDLFAYCAARLASGVISYEQVGPRYDTSEIVKFPVYEAVVSEDTALGIVTGIMETFGNAETNIRIEDFEKLRVPLGGKVYVTVRNGGKAVFSKEVAVQRSFGFAEPGSEVVYNSFTGFMGIAVNQGNFAGKYNIGCGRDWQIEIKKVN